MANTNHAVSAKIADRAEGMTMNFEQLRRKIATRARDFRQDVRYRAVLIARLKLAFVRLLFPDVQVLGFRDHDDSMAFLHAGDNAVTPYTLAVGNISRDDIQDLLAILRREAAFEDGKIFLEIGANVGTSTLAAVRSGAFRSAVAFEPVPDNASIVAATVGYNGLQDIVTLEVSAVSDADGESKMLLSSNNKGDHRMATDESVGDDSQEVTVPTVSLDSYLKKNGIQERDIGLIWMDAQGHEGLIFAGAKSFLSQRAVPVYTEFSPFLLREKKSLENIMEVIRSSFSRFYVLQRNSMHAAAEINAVADSIQGEDYVDLLLLP